MFGPSGLVQTILGVGQMAGGQGLKVFEHLNSRIFPGLPLVKFLGDGFISLIHNPLKMASFGMMLLLILKSNGLDIANSIIFPKSGNRIFHGGISIGVYFVDGPEILGSNFMDDVGAIRFISLFLLKEAQLSSLAKFLQIVIQIPVVDSSSLQSGVAFAVLVHIVDVDVGIVDDDGLVDGVDGGCGWGFGFAGDLYLLEFLETGVH